MPSRRLPAAAVVTPAVVAVLCFAGWQAGLYGTAVGVTLFALGAIAILVSVVVWMASYMEAADAERRKELKSFKRLRREAHEKHALLTAIVDATTDSVAFKEPGGHYRMINRAGARMFGLTEPEVIGHRDVDLLDPEEAEAVLAADRAAIESGRPVTREIPIEVEGRTRVMLSTSRPARDEHGAVIGVVAVSADITERRQIQVELESARAEALDATRLKSEFLAHMSEEIRTPMNGVIGMTELLLDTRLTEEQREYAEMLRESGEALLDIVNDIVDLSKIEAGKMELEPAFFDLHEMVEDIGELLARRAHDKGLELAVAIEDEVPHAARGDRARIRQVLVNLISNAVKFTAEGEVVVSVSVPEERDGAATLRFEVTDTGIGIDEDKAADLFEPFSQADRSAARRAGGTGLGLTISRQLVEMMGGAIGARGEIGHGSTFWFELPLERRPGPARASDRPPLPAELQGLDVLIADDNATCRRVVAGHADAWGLRTDVAEDGARALEMMKAGASKGEPYAIAILDMHMPGIDGLELARMAVDDPAYGSPAIVAVTSSDEPMPEGDANVFAAHLRKPVRQEKLRAALRAAAVGAGKGLGRPGPAGGTEEAHEQGHLPAPGGGRVLVAEDNVVNQKVVLRLLEKRGYDVDVVADGRQAVEAVKEGDYAVVLMDCHMPGMDGYDATREIRRHEGAARRTPVVAMTATAMEGDRERCLAAGMDDYLSKPLEPVHVNAVLEYWVGVPDGEAWPDLDEEPEPQHSEANGVSSLLDGGGLDDLRQRTSTVRGSALIVDLVGLYLRDAPRRVAAIEEAVAAHDPDALRQAAQALRASSRTLGAARIAEVCTELQQIGASGSVMGAAPLVADLKQGFALTRRALEKELSSKHER